MQLKADQNDAWTRWVPLSGFIAFDNKKLRTQEWVAFKRFAPIIQTFPNTPDFWQYLTDAQFKPISKISLIAKRRYVFTQDRTLPTWASRKLPPCKRAASTTATNVHRQIIQLPRCVASCKTKGKVLGDPVWVLLAKHPRKLHERQGCDNFWLHDDARLDSVHDQEVLSCQVETLWVYLS